MKRSAAAAMMRVSKRRFGVQEVRPAVGRTALGGSASGAVADAADAIFADAKAFLDSPEAGQMNQSDLERELNRRRRELVGSLLQACRDQRNREQAAGPVDTGVESAERCEHDDGESISGGVQVGRPDDRGAALAGGCRSLPGRGHRRAGRHYGIRPHPRQGCSGGGGCVRSRVAPESACRRTMRFGRRNPERGVHAATGPACGVEGGFGLSSGAGCAATVAGTLSDACRHLPCCRPRAGVVCGGRCDLRRDQGLRQFA